MWRVPFLVVATFCASACVQILGNDFDIDDQPSAGSSGEPLTATLTDSWVAALVR